MRLHRLTSPRHAVQERGVAPRSRPEAQEDVRRLQQVERRRAPSAASSAGDAARASREDGTPVADERSWTTAVAEYLAFLRHEQNASRTTQTAYAHGLRRFTRFLLERYGLEPALAEVTVEDCRSYLYELSRKGLRPRTLRGAMYPIRGLFEMAVDRKYLAANPAKAVKLPKKDAAQRETVSDEELTALLRGCERERDPLRRAMRKAVLAVLIYTGLRRQELLDLQVGDVDLAEGKLLVRSGKGSKSRSLYLCQDCIGALRTWLGLRPQATHPFLFVTDVRRRLGEDGLRRLIEEVKSVADLRDHTNIKPHTIRHAAATRLMRNGADLRSIQQFLGHNHLQTTAIYLHTDELQLQRIAEFSSFGRNPGEQANPKNLGSRDARSLRRPGRTLRRR